MASVGQVSAQAPHDTQADSRKPSSRPGGDVRARSRGRWRSARTCPGPRRRRARSARRRCTARAGRPGRDGARRASTLVLRRRASAARRRRASRATCGELGVRAPGGSGSSDSTSSTTARGDAARGRVARVDHHARRGTASCTTATGPGAPSTPTRQTRQAPNGAWRSSKQSVGICAPAARAASSTVVPGGDLDLVAVDRRRVIMRSPSSSGKCASRLRIGAGMPPPWAHRLPSSSVSSSASSCARSTGCVAREHRRARAAARSGTGSTCRSSRRRRSAAGAWRPRACRSARRRRRSRRGRPCSPRAASGVEVERPCRAAQPGRMPAERAADLQRLDRARRRAGRRRRPRTARAPSCRTAPRRRPGRAKRSLKQTSFEPGVAPSGLSAR